MALEIERRPARKLLFAIPLVVVSTLFFALMGTIVKIGTPRLTPEAMFFWRNFISLVIIFPWITLGAPKISIKQKLKTAHWKLQLVRGLSSFAAVFLYFYSLKFLDLTDATLLLNTMPIFIPLIARIWAKIVIHHRLWWPIGLAFVGIACILKPGTGIFNPASLIALASGIFGALSLVSVRISHFTEPPQRTLFYLFFICMLCSGVLTLFSFDVSWLHLTQHDLMLLILIGITGFLYQFTMTFAAKFAPARILSPFLYFTVLFALVLDVAIWHTQIPLMTYLGFFLIVAGAVLLLLLYPKEDFKKSN